MAGSEINILSVQRIYDDNADQEGAEIKQTVNFLVTVDDQQCPPWLLLEADDGTTEIPPIGYLLDDLIIISKSVRRRPESRLHFEVQCNLSNGNIPLGGGEGIKWNLSLHIGGAAYTENTYENAEGEPILNGAGMTFADGIPETYVMEEITVTFDTDKVDQSNIGKCRNRLNQETITMNVNGYKRTFLPKQLKLKDCTQDTTLDLNKYIDPSDPRYSRFAPQYWTMRYVFEYRPYRDLTEFQANYTDSKLLLGNGKQVSGFARMLLDQGLAEIGDDGKLKKIMDETGINPVSTPQKLDAHGKYIKPTNDDGTPNTECHWIVVETPSCKTVLFAPLFKGLGM